jgi:hypothetical protein
LCTGIEPLHAGASQTSRTGSSRINGRISRDIYWISQGLVIGYQWITYWISSWISRILNRIYRWISMDKSLDISMVIKRYLVDIKDIEQDILMDIDG